MTGRTDVLVVGGGVMGLWAAVKAADAGLDVVLIDRGRIGGGASGGLLGAVFPWMPDRWDAKKQFQYEALVSLPAELARLEAATGLSAGYRASGRIIPLPKTHLRAIALRHQADARLNWHQDGRLFDWHVLDAPPVAGYLAEDCGAGGYVHDTLAARLEPRAVVRVLRTWLGMQPNVRIFEHVALVALDAASGTADVMMSGDGLPPSVPLEHGAPPSVLPDISPTRGENCAEQAHHPTTVVEQKAQSEPNQRSLEAETSLYPFSPLVGEMSGRTEGVPASGRTEGGVPASGRTEGGDAVLGSTGAKTTRTIRFDRAIIAAGVECFPILETLLPPMPKPLGQGVKGQAALFDCALNPALPVAFLDGIYIVPHENGRVAVGSTSENRYAEPFSTDALLDTVIERARVLVPALRNAEVVERWAGLRPRSVGRDPLVGPVGPVGPVGQASRVIALTGGFKITFGMAHRLAEAAIALALGKADGLPENFTLAGQIAREMPEL